MRITPGRHRCCPRQEESGRKAWPISAPANGRRYANGLTDDGARPLMTTSTTGQEPRKDETPTSTPTAEPKKIIGRFVDSANGRGTRTPLAVFCHEPPDSFIGAQVAQLVTRLAKGRTVHLFSRHPFDLREPNVRVQAVGGGDEEEPVAQAREYVKRAANAFLQTLPAGKEA